MNILDTPDIVWYFQPVRSGISWRSFEDNRGSRRRNEWIAGAPSWAVRHIILRGSNIEFSDINKGDYSSFEYHIGTEAGTSYIEFKKDLMGKVRRPLRYAPTAAQKSRGLPR